MNEKYLKLLEGSNTTEGPEWDFVSKIMRCYCITAPVISMRSWADLIQWANERIVPEELLIEFTEHEVMEIFAP